MIDYVVPRAVEYKSGHHKFQLELRNNEILTDFIAQKESMKATCGKLEKYMERTLGREAKKQQFDDAFEEFQKKAMEEESSEDEEEIWRRKKEEKRKKKEEKDEKEKKRKRIFEESVKLSQKSSESLKSSLLSEIKAKTSGLIK